jgi:FkbM family methyltransferase|tara:strand:- start:3982 stop:4827 length:846 start_codon:yes stop_codon:yes gene_type:complete
VKEKLIVKILNSSLVRNSIIIKIGRFFMGLREKEFVEIEGRKMFCHGNDGLALSLFKTYEPVQTEIVKKFVKKGDNVIDVGAHVGYYTFLMAKMVGNEGKVYSFEPDPENFALLKKGIEANNLKNVEIIQKAVSNTNSTIKLFLSDTDRATNRIYDAGINDAHKIIEVETCSIDEFLNEKEIKIDFVKIDAEGSEQGVIEGMKTTLKNNSNITMMTEFFPFLIEKYGSSPKKYLQTLEEMSFNIQNIMEDGVLSKINKDSIIKNSNIENFCTNLLCTKSSK